MLSTKINLNISIKMDISQSLTGKGKRGWGTVRVQLSGMVGNAGNTTQPAASCSRAGVGGAAKRIV